MSDTSALSRQFRRVGRGCAASPSPQQRSSGWSSSPGSRFRRSSVRSSSPRLTEALGRKTTVEAVAFDPFRLRVTVRQLAIADGDRPVPLVAFDELVADLSTASIWHRAPVLDALRIVRPAVSLSRDLDGRYNVQDLVDRASAEPDGPTPRFSLNNIEVDDGVIAFDDGVAGRKHRVEALDVAIPFLSSLPYHTDIRVTPKLNATFNGSRLNWAGRPRRWPSGPRPRWTSTSTRCRSRTTSPICRRSRASSSPAAR